MVTVFHFLTTMTPEAVDEAYRIRCGQHSHAYQRFQRARPGDPAHEGRYPRGGPGGVHDERFGTQTGGARRESNGRLRNTHYRTVCGASHSLPAAAQPADQRVGE